MLRYFSALTAERGRNRSAHAHLDRLLVSVPVTRRDSSSLCAPVLDQLVEQILSSPPNPSSQLLSVGDKLVKEHDTVGEFVDKYAFI